jgi:hypothetical protein
LTRHVILPASFVDDSVTIANMPASLRIPTAIHGVASLLLAWLFMQAVHEAGHVLGAWLSGGHVVRVVLHPLAISRTDVAPNPNPLFEIWAGPVFGVVFPLALWITSGLGFPPAAAWLRFFAGFCLIANGAYLGYGLIEPIGDAQELIRFGAPSWCLGLFGLITVLGGLALWHGLGPEFGMGPHGRAISWRAATTSAAALLIVSLIELGLSGRE